MVTGWARRLIEAVEEEARDAGFDVLQLDVRETQTAAIRLYEALGWVLWGTNPVYARVHGRTLQGYYFYKLLRGDGAGDDQGRSGPA